MHLPKPVADVKKVTLQINSGNSKNVWPIKKLAKNQTFISQPMVLLYKLN